MTFKLKSISESLPGDIIFFSREEGRKHLEEDLAQRVQMFWSNISFEGASQTHVGVIVDPLYMEPYIREKDTKYELSGPKDTSYCSICKNPNDYIWISQNYAASAGPHIVIWDRKELITKYKICVISPIQGTEDFHEELRKVISRVAFCFSRSIPNCEILGCSNYHFWINPHFQASTLPRDSFLEEIGMGILSFAAGCPSTQKFEKENVKTRTFFCSEYAYHVVQVAYCFMLLDANLQAALEERFASNLKTGNFESTLSDLGKNHEDLLVSIQSQLLDKWKGEEGIPDSLLENSKACSPGRLYTLLTRGQKFKLTKLSVAWRVLDPTGRFFSVLPRIQGLFFSIILLLLLF